MDRCSNRTVGLLAAGLAGAAALAVLAGEPGATRPREPSAEARPFEPSGVVRPLPHCEHAVTQAAYPPPGHRRAIFDWQSQGPALPGDDASPPASANDDDHAAPRDDPAAPSREAIIVLPEVGAPPAYPGAALPRRDVTPPPMDLAPPLPDRTTSAEPASSSRPSRVAQRPPQDPWGDDNAAAAEIPAAKSMPEVRPRPEVQRAGTPQGPQRPAQSDASAPRDMRRRQPSPTAPEAASLHAAAVAPSPALAARTAGMPLESRPVADRADARRADERPAVEADPSAALPASEAPRTAIPDVVSRRALDEVRRGFELADRRAYFSARNAFFAALREVAEALDAESGSTQHGQALAAALRAMDESDDFVADAALTDAEWNVAAVAAAHRTPALRGDREEFTPAQARRQYYAYAQEQFAAAVAGEPAGAAALFGLGKLHTVLIDVRPAVVAVAPSKALVFYRATLAVDPGQAAAANELGVALAREGRYAEARDWLVHSALVAPRQATWHNLATVHERLGEAELAARARAEMNLAGAGGGQPAARVEWIDPVRFAARSELAAPAAADPAGAARSAADSSSSRQREQKRGLSRWLPWK